MALLCAAYGWTPLQVAEFTPAQIRYFLDNLPEVALRQAYPTAALEATILNMMGGKRQKDGGEDSEPPLAPHERFSPFERLPWYASPSWIDEVQPSIRPEAARDFLTHRRNLPAWVLQIAPIDSIVRAAEADGG